MTIWMKGWTRRWTGLAECMALVAVAAQGIAPLAVKAQAKGYPDKPVKILLSYPLGAAPT